MLLSAGVPLPEKVFGHGFVYIKGERMSKTLGNIINPLDIVDRFGPDPLRYYLMREGSWGRDSDFTWENFIERYNRDLANDLGNLLSRTIGMVSRYQNNVILPPGALEPVDQELEEICLKESSRFIFSFNQYANDLETHNILVGIWRIVRSANRYVDSQAPWVEHKKGNLQRVSTILYQLVETLRFLSILLSPFIPATSKKIWKQIGLAEISSFDEESTEHITSWGQYPYNTLVEPGEALFPKIETTFSLEDKGERREESGTPEDTTVQRDVAADTSKPVSEGVSTDHSREEKGEKMDTIEYSDFQKVILRTATVISAERVPETDKLIKMQLALGDERREIVAGIGDTYSPQELKDRDIVIVANLKPRKIRGILSQGMLLAVEDGETLSLLTLDKKMRNGLRVV
jgi:methionyl-tRNA synthetase